jgi:hypothetical protein
VQSLFQGGEGLTLEGLIARLGDVWSSIDTAIQGAGGSLAARVCEFFMADAAEGQLGETVGWLAGTIAFEVLLGILTAGAWQPVSAAGKALKAFARILDWTGEALGAAFRLLGRIGGMVIDALQGLRRMLGKAGGAVMRVLDALGEIGQKLLGFADELLARFGRGVATEAGAEVAEKAAREAAEKAAREAAEKASKEAAEKAAKEAAEEAAEKAAKEGAEEAAEEGAEEAAEEGAEEAAEEGAEQGGKKADDAPDMTEKLRVAAQAKVVSDMLERKGMPASAIASALQASFKPRYRWIKRFEVARQGVRSLIYMIASKVLVDEVDRPEGYSDLTDEELEHILDGEFSAENIHVSGGHGYPQNIKKLEAKGYTQISSAEFNQRFALEKPYDDAMKAWKSGNRKTRGPRPRKENFGLAADHVTLREQKVFYFDPAGGGSYKGGVLPAKNPIHIDGKTWLPDGWGKTDVEAVTRHMIATVNPTTNAQGTMKIYTTFVKIENGVIETSATAAPGFLKVSLLDNGTKRTLFPQMNQ